LRRLSERTISLTISALIVFAAFYGLISGAGAETEALAPQGLWLTEIYQDDVDRSSVYSASGDLMEYVEIVNTSEQDILFNEMYELRYEYPAILTDGKYISKALTVADGEGNSNITIRSGEVVVIWSYRPDIAAGSRAGETEFRREMDLPAGAQVWKCSGQNGFAENRRGFFIVDKRNGRIISRYRYNFTADTVTADGLAVHLQIPDYGCDMRALETKKPTSAGIVYNEQLNGQLIIPQPEDLTPEGLYITEIYPREVRREEIDGKSGSLFCNYMECLEVTNTTDRDIDFNREYKLYYMIKEDGGDGSAGKLLPLYRTDRLSTDCLIPAGGTAVLWNDRKDLLKAGEDRGAWPTEDEFRAAHGIPDGVPVFIFTNQNGLGDSDRGLALRKNTGKTKSKPVSYYFWDSVDDLKYKRSVDLRVSPEGPKMSVYRGHDASSLGVIDSAQVTYPADDGSWPALELLDDASSIAQGDSLRIPYSFAGTASMPVTAIELYYRIAGASSFQSVKTRYFPIYNKWYAFIPSALLLDADYVDYYVKASNDYRFTRTDVRRMSIVKINDASGLRVSFNGETAEGARTVSGTLRLTAKNFVNPAMPVTVKLEGKELKMHAALERCAFFTFKQSGADGYFKNALTCGDQVVDLFAGSSEFPDTSRAIRVDGSLFTYNPDGSAMIELAVRSGTYGSPWEYGTAANHDDFTIEDVALSLPDGAVLLPGSYRDQNGKELTPAASVKMGDSPGCTVWATAVFNVPADKIDAAAVAVDTTALANGVHRLTVTSGGLSEIVTFKVDNRTPRQEEGAREAVDLHMPLAVQTSGDQVKASLTTAEKAENITVYEAKYLTGIKVYEGAGDSTAAAVEKTDNGAAVSSEGGFPYQIYEIATDGKAGDKLRFEVEADVDYNREIRLYALNTERDTWDLLESGEREGVITAVFPLRERLRGGKVRVLVQARGKESAPYTGAVAGKTQKNSYYWDGASLPEQYDFSIAWISDTQYYAEQYFDNFEMMADWIVSNKDSLSIKYLIHTGDIVDEYDEEYQYINASRQLRKFEQADLPYGVLAGNHDVAHGNERYRLYHKYFGEDRYRRNPVYGGGYKNNLGHYDLLTVDGTELLFIYMSWDMYLPEIAWINGVLERYPERTAIICIHGGIKANAQPSYFSDLILENVCRTHPNVQAVLSGHHYGSSLNFVGFDDDGDGHDERVLYQICTDYQGAPGGGQAYIKMLYFDLANGKIYINSYSPLLDDFNYYDTPKLPAYGSGIAARNIDIAELAVDFKRETVKTLKATGYMAALLTGRVVGAAPAEAAHIPLSAPRYAPMTVYAEATEKNGKVIAYSDTVTFTPDAPRLIAAGEGGVVFSERAK
jgi:hypothetical protein